MPACGVVERVAINISEFFDAEWLRLGQKRHEKGSFNINQNDPKPLFFFSSIRAGGGPSSGDIKGSLLFCTIEIKL